MNKEIKELLPKLILPFILVGMIWSVELYEHFSHVRLSRYGIYPREWDGLIGIITGPFVHGDWQHLISNTFPLFVLTSLMMVFYRKVAYTSLILITILTGFSVWLFARESYHIGASGVIYGLIAFVFGSGIFRGNSRSTILALAILVMYSGYFQGFQLEDGVSWESHMLGALSGLLVSFVLKNVKEDGEDDDIHFEPTERSTFLPADTFEKTKYQRWLDSMIEHDSEE